MMRLLFRKSLRESRWLLLGCSLAIFAFCWLRVWVVSRMSTDRFRAILEMLPGDWRRFLTVDFDWLITYPGRISLAYQELIVVLCMSVWSIARGSDIVSGELNRGTMEMLLAQPLSRSRIMVTQSIVALVGAATLALAAWAGTSVGIHTTAVKEQRPSQLQLPLPVPGLGRDFAIPLGPSTTERVPMHEKVDHKLFWPASINLFALGAMIAGVSALISACDRYRWRTIGIVSVGLIAQMLLKMAGMAVEGWRWLTYLTVLSAYEPEGHVRLADTAPEKLWTLWQVDQHGNWERFAPLAHDLLLLGMAVAGFAAATIVFSRRDLPAPL
jgi:ABC-2 type transport system permease protein